MLSRVARLSLGAAAREAGASQTRASAAAVAGGRPAVYIRMALPVTAVGASSALRRYSTAPVATETASAVVASSAQTATSDTAASAAIAITDPAWWAAAVHEFGSHAVRGEVAAAGRGNYTPVGAIENALEFVSATSGLPWWMSIVATTAVVKLCLLPLVVRSTRNGVLLNNVAPAMEKHTTKMKAYNLAGERDLAILEAQQLREVMNKGGANPFMSFALPLIQGPIFISFFLALRSMATVPLETLKDGGYLWFKDLTVADPYYILPAISSGFTFLLIQKTLKQMPPTSTKPLMSAFMRVISIATFPIAATLPTANLVYWVIANGFTVSQMTLLTSSFGKRYFNIPERVVHAKPSGAPSSSTGIKGFIEDIKMGYNAAAKMIDDRTQPAPKGKDAAVRKEADSFEKQLEALRMSKIKKSTQ